MDMTEVAFNELGNQYENLANRDNPESFVEISVLVPAHNEEGTIEDCLKRITKVLKSNDSRYEIIVIDDGSTDKTYACSQDIARWDGGSVRIIRNASKCGKGAALMAASKNSRGEILVVLDADLEYAPEDVLRVVDPIEQGVSDAVFGSRFRGQTEGMSLSHRLGNTVLTATTNFLYGGQLTDVMTGYKAFRRAALEQLGIGEPGFGFEVEVAAKALRAGLRISEVPIKYRRRTSGRSKIRWIDGLRCLFDLFQLTRRKRQPA
jgi:glycosyltransferase involved in cell wall biosynthesis